ncbi:enhancer of split M1 protein-like [Hermetia illucens]|uniref:enhancer of split M1 protein-like n=1 Tax=Hermetia illucens TaxID=343691 RepID=UPI0018CBFF6B|nr:enhancer of split M1 protein-like [Hermetia illucens]
MTWIRYICWLVLVLGTIAQDTFCPQICPRIYRPVCAIENFTKRTFSNQCEVRKYNCQYQRNFLLLKQGRC